MNENLATTTLNPGDELLFQGLRLARGPIRTQVRCRSERIVICDYRVGGVDRHLIVDLETRRRQPVPAERSGSQEETIRCRELRDDVEAGRVHVAAVTPALVIVIHTA